MSELVDRLSELSQEEQDYVLKSIDILNGLTPHERGFVTQYCESLRQVHKPYQNKLLMSKPHVQLAVNRMLAYLEGKSELRAEYVRQFIFDVLELCPTDYFIPALGGGWLIDVDSFRDLPFKVKRLIEDVELRQIRGERFFAIRFVSKTAVLQLAARFTLAQKVDVNVSNVPWDKIAQPPSRAEEVEQRLLTYERRLQEGVGAQAAPVA
jgi:hypothetical protein